MYVNINFRIRLVAIWLVFHRGLWTHRDGSLSPINLSS